MTMRCRTFIVIGSLAVLSLGVTGCGSNPLNPLKIATCLDPEFDVRNTDAGFQSPLVLRLAAAHQGAPNLFFKSSIAQDVVEVGMAVTASSRKASTLEKTLPGPGHDEDLWRRKNSVVAIGIEPASGKPAAGKRPLSKRDSALRSDIDACL